MGLQKYATVVLAVEAAELAPGAPIGLVRMASLALATRTGAKAPVVGLGWTKQAHRHEFSYDPRPGFLYVRSRAISSRINDNFDGFPAEEIKRAYATFIGKPVFVNHHNSDHRKARGVIIDAALHEDVNPDGTPDTWVEVLMEVDAVRYPLLAKAVLAGQVDRTSMGTDVAYSICTFCGNKASSPLQYCAHIPRLKGRRIRRMTASGTHENVLVAEMCFGLGFFENSLLVEPPADPTAFTFGVDARGLEMTSSNECEVSGMGFDEAQEFARREIQRSNDRQRWGSTNSGTTASVSYRTVGLVATAIGEQKAPPKVDTLRDAQCPVCGEEDGYNGSDCAVCQFVKPPDMFMDPDTELARSVDLRQEEQDGISDMENASGTGDLVCDNCGTEFNDVDATEEPALDGEEGEKPETDLFAGDEGEFDPAPKDQELPPKQDDPKDLGAEKKPPVEDGTDPATDQSITEPGDDEEDVEEPETTQPQAGDTCPDCGKGLLQKKSPEEVPVNADPPAEVESDDEKPPFPPKGEGDDASEGKTSPAGEDPKDDDEDGDDKKKSKPPWLNKKKSSLPGSILSQPEGVPSMAPRSFHLVAAEQQASIDYIAQGMVRIAQMAGVPLDDLQNQRLQRVASIRRVALEDPQINPAQPPGFAVPTTPATEAPAQTTQEAATPTATDDPQNIGATPLTNVAPDAQTSLSDSGPVLDAPLDLNEQNVTAPVAGTTEQRPLSETKTEDEVRVGEGDNISTAFPLQGDFANRATTGSAAPTPMEQAQARLFAGQRLANLRIAAGIADGDATVLAQRIATDASVTDGAIRAEIETLSQVVANRPQSQAPRLTTSARRTTPSFAGGSGAPQQIQANLDPATGGLAKPTDDEFLWE